MTTPRPDASDTQPGPPAPEPPVPVIVTPVAARSSRNGSGGAGLLNIALGAALLVGVAGVSFAVGRVTAPATSGAATVSVTDGGTGEGTLPGGEVFRGEGQLPDGVVPGNGQGGRGFVGFTAGPTVEGTVDSVTADSLTIKLESGQTITVGLSDDTTYHQQADADASDVQAGKSVILRLSGGFRPGSGDGTGSSSLGTASDVTVVP